MAVQSVTDIDGRDASGRAGVDHAAVVEHGDAVADGVGALHVVRHEDGRDHGRRDPEDQRHGEALGQRGEAERGVGRHGLAAAGLGRLAADTALPTWA